MPPAAPPEGQERSTAAPVARRASKAPRSVLTAEDVLAATGCRSFDALLCASLPSHGIASLSPSFTSLHNLCDLDVSGNLLADLSALATLPCLRRLNAAGNCVALPWSAPDAGGSTHTPAGWFPSLEWLDLSYNQLEPEALLLLQRLPRLRELDISGNALQALPALGGGAFPALHRLAAGHNDLASGALAALAGLPVLQQLVLQHNRVGELPPLPPAAFARLELLDLSHNRLADVAAVQRLQRLPSIQRLLLAGCPVARAGFGAAGTLAGTLHQAQAGAGRGGRGPAGAGGGRSGKPSLAQTFQFSAVVEEASAVSLRAKGQARRGTTASSAAGTASMHSSATTSACPTRPGTGGPAEAGSAPTSALQAAATVRASATAQPQADGSTTTKAGAEGGEAAAGVSLIEWPEDIDSSEGEEDGDSWHAQCADWSTGSAHGSGSTADDAMLSLEGDGSDDPTMRLALALGLDPLLLPAAGGPGVAGSPAAAVKALRFALAHPSSTPSLSAGPASGGNHHLAMTAATLAKQRRKAGEGGQQGTGAGSRLQQIDGMLAAMKRRLRAVQAAMAADLEKAQGAGEQQQKQEQQALGAIEEGVGSPRPAGDMQQQPQEGNQEAQGTAATPPAPDGQPILQLSTSGKHTQAHNLLVNVLAGLPAQSDRPASRGSARPTSPAVTSRSGAAQGSPRLKRPSVVATELHAFADALKERQ